ncbi:glycosyltransferase [Candidatus Lokiarchaeum ossiferum]|uniref:glycosyltransferase n=1 Tax=Candidatus Lokiarchaeum ossiferum TaxID=2951803 RepID=UPI00352F46DE
MRILFFGSYHATYSRNEILLRGLQENGVKIIHCNILNTKNIKKKIKLFQKALSTNFDIIFVAFPAGYFSFPLAMCLRLLKRKPIVFDTFISIYNTKINDHKSIKKGSLVANFLREMERFYFSRADIVIADTLAHLKYYSKEFNIPESKFRCIYVGSNDKKYFPVEMEKNGEIFNVLFFGNYIPLQGVPIIFAAAKLLIKNKKIKFTMIGGNDNNEIYQDMRNFSMLNNLENVEIIPFLHEENLILKLREADLLLGIFGKTIKTNLVIPNKVFAGIALQKPVLTLRTQAIQELFKDNHDIILCKTNNPNDLAEKIVKSYKQQSELQKISINGYKTYIALLTPYKIGKDLKEILQNFLYQKIAS